MIKIVSTFVLAVLFTGCFQANAQLNRRNDQGYQQGTPGRQRPKQSKDTSFADHLRWGFCGGLSAGNGGGYIEFDPNIGYQFNKQWLAGVGVSYSYLSTQFYDANGNPATYSTSIYGGRLFAEYHFLPFLFAHAEYEAMNFDYYNYDPNTGLTTPEGRVWVANPLIGLGYKSQLGRKAYYYIMVLYDLNYSDPRSAQLYGFPFVPRIGFEFGI